MKDYIEIKLSQNKIALIDKEDFIRVSQFTWFFSKKNKTGLGYAQRSQHIKLGFKSYKTKTIYLHHFILGITTGEVDHKNGDPLDCRKDNLRVGTHQMNLCNRASRIGSTSKYVGVHFHKLTGKWRVQIKVEGKKKSLGLFVNPEEAKAARDDFIMKNNLEWYRR